MGMHIKPCQILGAAMEKTWFWKLEGIENAYFLICEGSEEILVGWSFKTGRRSVEITRKAEKEPAFNRIAMKEELMVRVVAREAVIMEKAVLVSWRPLFLESGSIAAFGKLITWHSGRISLIIGLIYLHQSHKRQPRECTFTYGDHGILSLPSPEKQCHHHYYIFHAVLFNFTLLRIKSIISFRL